MLVKKLLLMAGLLMTAGISLQAQESQPKDPSGAPESGTQWSNRDMTYRGKNYDIMDSAYYPKFRRKQFHRYMEHQEAFPPKPRSMWELGLGLGLYNVVGDIPSLMLWQKGGGGISFHVRKSLGYIFSLRAEYIYGVGKNLDRQPTQSYDAPYTQFGYVPLNMANPPGIMANGIYRATRTEASQLNLDLVFNAYNINFHKARNSVSFFGYLGLGALGYKTRVNALGPGYATYDFSKVVTQPNAKDNDIRKELQKNMDKTFETPAENNGTKHILDNKTLDFAPSVGAGIAYKINKQFNIQVEERYTFPRDGYIDGTRFGPALGNSVASGHGSDAINFFSVGINYNFNPQSGKKAVEPLYWINPLDHAYNELSYPRHMILPNPVLPDADHDGITDQFDKCPKTPKDVPTDAHGCPMDTDGDGVPDYKDKQLITPTECQPVDADGVGSCPCPEGCDKDKITHEGGGNDECGRITANTIVFGNDNNITTQMQAQLATLAVQMKAGANNCKVVIIGGGNGSKQKEQKSWEHVNAVIEYMSEKNNISRDRFIFKYGEAGNESMVTYRPANVDDKPGENPPPPHPNLKTNEK